jgi:hypothetical protein
MLDLMVTRPAENGLPSEDVGKAGKNSTRCRKAQPRLERVFLFFFFFFFSFSLIYCSLVHLKNDPAGGSKIGSRPITFISFKE